jgi:ribosome-binding factor A
VKKYRQERMADIIACEVATILRTKAADSRLMMATITGAKVTKDLKIVYLYVSVLGDDKARKQAMSHLQRATGFLKAELNRRLELRYTPEIVFFYDEGIERGQRIISEIEEMESHADSDSSESEKNE